MTPIERIEALLAEATPGPWHMLHDDVPNHPCTCAAVWSTSSDCPLFHPDREFGPTGAEATANSRLIAALRNAAPALLRLVKAVGTIVWNHRDKHPDRQQDPIVALLFERRRWNDVVVALAELTKDEDQ